MFTRKLRFCWWPVPAAHCKITLGLAYKSSQFGHLAPITSRLTSLYTNDSPLGRWNGYDSKSLPPNRLVTSWNWPNNIVDQQPHWHSVDTWAIIGFESPPSNLITGSGKDWTRKLNICFCIVDRLTVSGCASGWNSLRFSHWESFG